MQDLSLQLQSAVHRAVVSYEEVVGHRHRPSIEGGRLDVKADDRSRAVPGNIEIVETGAY